MVIVMSSKRKLKKKSLLFIIITFILGIGIILAATNLLDNPKIPVPGKSEPVVEEPKDKVYTAKFLAGGDALIHKPVRNSGKQADGTWNYTSQFDMIRDILAEYDIKFYNQESLISGNDEYYPTGGGLYFNTPKAYGDAAVEAGFNLISLANNHSMDVGTNGALGSVNYWKTKEGIIFDGMTDSEEMRNDYTRLIGEANGITYGFLAYTTSTNGNPVPKNKPFLVNTYNEEKVKQDIAALRDKVDVLIVSMHWGIEYILEPNAEEKKIANFLAEQKVDIVIGNHAHCIQPIEKIGDTVVFYALGNLISNQGYLTATKPGQYGQKVTIGALGTLTITKTIRPDGESKIEIGDIGAELIYTHSAGPAKGPYKIIPFSKIEAKHLTILTSEYKKTNGLEKLYNDYKSVLTKYDDTINVVELQSKIATG